MLLRKFNHLKKINLANEKASDTAYSSGFLRNNPNLGVQEKKIKTAGRILQTSFEAATFFVFARQSEEQKTGRCLVSNNKSR